MNADEVRHGWATRATEFSPGYYAYYGPNETSDQVRRTLERFVGREAAVLEVGCSSGRHLAHLHNHGFRSLHGLDINDDAFEVMAAEYPELATAGTFYHDSIENAVGGMADGQFAAVYSVETLQHVHADEAWIFGELARITDDVFLTVECEGLGEDPAGVETPVSYDHGDFPLYCRPWKQIFTRLGLEQVATRSMGVNTLRAFRHT